MNTTFVLAQVLGILLIVCGLSMFSKKNMDIVVDEIFKNKGLLWVGGLLALLMGSVIIVLNNNWTAGMPVVVTIIGWLALIKGIFILIFPDTAIAFYRKILKSNIMLWAGVFVLLLGLLLFLK